MSESGLAIQIRPVEVNGELCVVFKNELYEVVKPLLSAMMAPIPPEFRPQQLPEDSICLIAEVATDSPASPEPAGSLALMPLAQSSPHAANLPGNTKAAEIKRMIVRPQLHRHGVATKLLASIEDLARTELGLGLLVLETLRSMSDARRFYESCGWQRREVFGAYDARDSQCYEKWL